MSGSEVYRMSAGASMLTFSGGQMKIKESDATAGISVRVLEAGRLGFAYCQAESGLDEALSRARRLSKFSVESGFSFAPQSQFPPLDVADPALEPDDIDLLRYLVEEAKDAAASKGGKPRVISSMEREEVRLENTAGLSGAYAKTTASLYVECMDGDGFGLSYLASTRKPGETASLGLRAAEMARSMQNAGKPDGGSYTVVMEVEALESLVETLLPSFSGDWKRRGITRLAEGKAFSGALSIYDDGLSAGVNARPFDDEGTPSARRALIENGEVKSFMYDRETAALAREERSGACTRGSYDSPPSIGASNIVISPGDRKDLGDLERFIEVHYAHGSHTANITSGDIGLEVSAAFLVEKGKRRPMKGFMLSGNVFDMFSNIEAIESSQRVQGSLIAPRIAFRDVRVVS
ncbi:MAG: TldD/PmbA family protein [Candidatus Micrarchaeota archaeon]